MAALEIADYGYVMENGRIVYSGIRKSSEAMMTYANSILVQEIENLGKATEMSSSIDAQEGGMDKSVRLRLEDVALSIGQLRILDEISFRVHDGDLLAIIGPNGAGKTSVLNCISGIYHPTSGRIYFDEFNLAGATPHAIARHGISRSFQHAELFRHLTVVDNLLVGRHTHMRCGLMSNGCFWGRTIKRK